MTSFAVILFYTIYNPNIWIVIPPLVVYNCVAQTVFAIVNCISLCNEDEDHAEIIAWNTKCRFSQDDETRQDVPLN